MSTSIPLLAMHQKGLGHTVSVATLGSAFGAEVQEARKRGVGIVAFQRSWPHFLFFSWGMLARLHRAVKSADVVHVHSLWTFPVWWGCCLACLHKKKLVMSPRGGLDPTRLAHSAWKKKMTGWIDRLCLTHATTIHATSVAESDWVTLYLGGTYQPKIRVVPNGLQLPDDDDARPPPSAGHRTLLSLGRLHPLKGLDVLVEAWQAVSASRQADGWKLIIAGPDEQGVKKQLLALCDRLNVTNCELRDGVFDEQKWDLLKRADLFVLPSKSENFGNVVGEALACGRPVVMTDVGPWKAEMKKYFGANASDAPIQFVEAGVPGLADGLSKAMALTDETRAGMGRHGRAWIRKEFRWERVAERMVEAYAN